MTEQIEKPPVLTSDKVLEYFRKKSRQLPPFGTEMHREIQQDADVAYYEPLIQQAKTEVVREMIEEIEKLWGVSLKRYMCDKLTRPHAECRWCSYQSLKSKYVKEEKVDKDSL